MNLIKLIFPYWLLFAFSIVIGIYIHKMKVIPTLKKYGRDYEDYWSHSKQKRQLEDYKKVCEKYGLSMKYYMYLKWYGKISFLLLIGWILFLFIADHQKI